MNWKLAHKKIEAYVAKHNVPLATACRNLNIDLKKYYYQRNRNLKVNTKLAAKPKPGFKTFIPQDAAMVKVTLASGAFIECQPEALAQVLAALN